MFVDIGWLVDVGWLVGVGCLIDVGWLVEVGWLVIKVLLSFVSLGGVLSSVLLQSNPLSPFATLTLLSVSLFNSINVIVTLLKTRK